MRIIVTGFAPFGGETVNPSYEAVKLLPDIIEGHQIIKLEMPVSYDVCPALLEWMVAHYRPDAVVCLGQASGRTAITPEYVAINLKHGSIPDNSGVRYADQPVIPDGPAAYFTKLPVRRMVAALQAAGLPGFVSYSAGTFVCNCLSYHLLHMIDTKYPTVKGGFIHVPYSTEQVKNKCLKMFAMETEEIAKAVSICLHTLIESMRDASQ
ncbi:MAG: pyroglutamyl-peptidase I [Clostridia bacterium]|nr:pyroglutamyl-peptidase I [Clostridia bacterium]